MAWIAGEISDSNPIEIYLNAMVATSVDAVRRAGLGSAAAGRPLAGSMAECWNESDDVDPPMVRDPLA
jgi:hypothetical protein